MAVCGEIAIHLAVRRDTRGCLLGTPGDDPGIPQGSSRVGARGAVRERSPQKTESPKKNEPRAGQRGDGSVLRGGRHFFQYSRPHEAKSSALAAMFLVAFAVYEPVNFTLFLWLVPRESFIHRASPGVSLRRPSRQDCADRQRVYCAVSSP